MYAAQERIASAVFSYSHLCRSFVLPPSFFCNHTLFKHALQCHFMPPRLSWLCPGTLHMAGLMDRRVCCTCARIIMNICQSYCWRFCYWSFNEAINFTRIPPSNSPVIDVTLTDMRCNVNGATGVSAISEVAGKPNTCYKHQVVRGWQFYSWPKRDGRDARNLMIDLLRTKH